MANNYPLNIEVLGVDDVQKCADIMESLIRANQPVALDAEGVSLSATGRMTLLQLKSMSTGAIYIIDLVDPNDVKSTVKARRLLVEGQVKRFVESPVLKVTQGCFHDSAALYHQFGITLPQQNVFDTQMAHLALEYSNNVCFPKSLPLIELLEKYLALSHTGNKDAVKILYHENKEYWLIRPLTPQMIEYAAEDVNVLVPQFYSEMKRRIDKARALEDFRHLVASEVLKDIDGRESGRRYHLVSWKVWRQCLTNLGRRCTPATPLSSLSDDEVRVLRQLCGRRDRDKYPASVQTLELAVTRDDLTRFSAKISSGQTLERWEIGRLQKISRTHHDSNLARQAVDVLARLNTASS